MSVDLSTNYLGWRLKNPLVVGSCPLTGEVDSLRRLEEAGVAAVVLPSLFEEQIEHEAEEISKVCDFGAESFPEALTYFPEQPDYHVNPEDYLTVVADAKRAVRIPVIASLNGTSRGGWVRYAKMIQDVGADGLELNIFYVAAELDQTGRDIETRYMDLVASVKQSITIPLAVKITPYFTALANMAARLVDAGADGLVLFNRVYQPDVDLATLRPMPQLEWSSPAEQLLALRWIAILRGRVQASLAATGGIHDAAGLTKALLVGADVGMIASAIYEKGVHQTGAILSGLQDWMAENGYDSVEQLKGSLSLENCDDTDAFQRGNYMKTPAAYSGKAI
ncbi:MAG: dihydroorotate dehydrogenase-like protein [Planctomycetaceae bacterium]|nr:dihydroorotate dehydrogenase-like protein [Planctomycetaceae bacterium]